MFLGVAVAYERSGVGLLVDCALSYSRVGQACKAIETRCLNVLARVTALNTARLLSPCELCHPTHQRLSREVFHGELQHTRSYRGMKT